LVIWLIGSGQNGFGFRHRPKFSQGYMSWQMIEAARTGYDGLLRGQPSMCCDPIGNQLPVLDVGGLHIDGAHAELFVPEQTLIMRGHIVFDEIEVAIDLANKIGLVATDVEITMPDLSI